MKRLAQTALMGLVLALAGLSCGQGDKPALVKTDAPKIAAAENEGWLTSFDEAKAQAAKRNVPILADFSGSDWCGWCIKLDKEVFSKPEFKDYAAKNLVLLLLDFPRRKNQTPEIKKQNETLSGQFGIEGFPTVVLLDANGKELARTGYQPGGAAAYVKHLQDLGSRK